MAEYKYKARDGRGQFKSGIMRGHNEQQVKSQLSRMRYHVIAVEAVSAENSKTALDGWRSYFGGVIEISDDGKFNINLMGTPKPKPKEFIIFTKQLAVMLQSGLSLTRALEVLAFQQSSRHFGLAIRKIRTSLENGAKFSQALATYPKYFDELYISMIRSAEESGKLYEILHKLVSYLEKTEKIKSQVKSALVLPGVIAAVAFVVVMGLLMFVIPSIAQQYSNSGKELPVLTQIVLNISDFLIAHWWAPFVGVAVLYGLFYSWVRTPKGRFMFDRYKLKAPIFGDLMRKIVVARFCSTLASMLSSGVNLLPSLQICAASSGNKFVEQFIYYVRQKIEQGQLLSQPLSTNPIFPGIVISMIQVGEKSGKIDEMLQKISDFYEEEVEVAVKNMLTLLEPVMIVVLGVVIGVIIVAMYLPLFDMGNLVD